MKATFKVFFFAQRTKLKKNGNAPILARITVNGKVACFSTQQDIPADRWDSKYQRTFGETKMEKTINGYLDTIQASASRHFYDIQAEGKIVTAEMVRQRLLHNSDDNPNTLLQLFDWFMEDYEKIAKSHNITHETVVRYHLVRARLAEFSEKTYKVKDIPLDRVDKKFVDNFYAYIRTEYQLNNNTAVRMMRKFSSVLKMGRDNGWLTHNPFRNVRMHIDPVDRSYLTMKELETVYNKEFPSKRLETVRDMFIFSCFTGLAYVDIYQLTKEDIIEKPDGKMWIQTKRQKTSTPVRVPLLDIPRRILEKYAGQGKNGHLLPVMCNQKMNDYIKEIMAICGIDKNVSFHCARHTFATTVTLENGVSIESVSRMLGHTNIRTTQIYARITEQKVAGDMDKLSEKLSGHMQYLPEPSAMSKEDPKRQRRIEQEILDYQTGRSNYMN